MREHVDLPTLQALDAEWQQHPPVHHLVAAYLGHKPPAKPGSVPTVTDFEDIAAAIGPMPVRTVAPLVTTDYDAALPPH